MNTLKVTAARLETIVSHYNELRTKIRPHEMALFTTKIDQMETVSLEIIVFQAQLIFKLFSRSKEVFQTKFRTVSV